MRIGLPIVASALAMACVGPNHDGTQNAVEREVRGVEVSVGSGGGTPGTSLNFELVGHEPLFARGMNAALAIFDHFVYVGNRSDGSSSCGDLRSTGPVVPVLTPTNPDGTCTHVHPGIQVVDVAEPATPAVVGEFGTE